jgi:phospholipase/carboxylesterase
MSGHGLESRVAHQPASPAGALVLLHGRGADELDLVPLLEELDPEQRLFAITLRAPLQLGPVGYHWYISRELGRPEPTSFLETYRRVGAWLDELPAMAGVGLDSTVLGGFSQGAVMAYALALGSGRPSPAALIALSGFIPQAPGFALDLPGHRELPVAVGHGTFDQVIPVEYGRAAVRRLRLAGFDAEYRETPMAHTLDPAFVGDLSHWLATVLERRQAA